MGFRENLKTQLLFAGLKTKDLAGLSGVKKQTIDSYLRENGYMPSAEAAVKIARALNVSVEWLVTGRETKNHVAGNAPSGTLQAGGFPPGVLLSGSPASGGLPSGDFKNLQEIGDLVREACGLSDSGRKTLATIAKALKKQETKQ